MTEILKGVDKVTFEVLRHRLWQITDEMAIMLKRVSGSPSTAQVHDFMVALYTKDGEILSGGFGVPWHITSASAACKHVAKKFASSIHEGDTFLLNDPYLAAIHQSDVYLVTPIHHMGKLVAWCANFVHVTDIGAIDPGGFSPRATSVFHEGMRFKGVKIVEAGELRTDLFDSIIGMSREPGMVALDLRSQIASNNVAKTRVADLIEKHGWKTIRAVMKGLIDFTEKGFRARLSELPDATWRTVQHIDILGKGYRIPLAMTKKGTDLLFDFEGASPQSPRGLNCTYWGALGGVMGAVFSLLCFGFPWNEGALRPVTVVAPEGSIINCRYPSPVSISTVAGTISAANGAITTISKMLGSSDKYSHEMLAVGNGCSCVIRQAGINQEGAYYVSGLWDWLSGSSGARSYADGVDTSGGQAGIMTMMQATNIESTESTYPLLYMFRGQSADSGGPGKFRGGVSGECCFTVYDAPEKRIDLIISGWGVEAAASTGLSGGYPGSSARFAMYKASEVEPLFKKAKITTDLVGVKAKVEELPPQWAGELSEGKYMYLRWAGGGGYGDPLERDVELVRADVEEELISKDAATGIYGVVFRDGIPSVDKRATLAKRKILRSRRHGEKIL